MDVGKREAHCRPSGAVVYCSTEIEYVNPSLLCRHVIPVCPTRCRFDRLPLTRSKARALLHRNHPFSVDSTPHLFRTRFFFSISILIFSLLQSIMISSELPFSFFGNVM